MFALPSAASAISAAAPAAAAGAAKAGLMATLKSVAINVATNLAISAAMSAFQPQVGVAGRTFEWTLDPDGPIPFAAGRIGVPGSAVYRKTFGPDLMYYGIPSVISGAGPIAAFEGFMADDETVTFDGSGKAVSSQYAGELWYKTSQGAQPATAITSPTGLKNGATLPGWTSAHKLSGKASYMIVMGENSKGTAFPTGEIKPLITLRGLLVYDPRKDSTYPGGSGEHRLSNPLTWEYSANPILWALKWTLGLWEGPNGKGAPQVDYQVGGIGAKLSGIDVPAFVAAANVADANGWTCAAYPTTDDDKHQVLTGFLQAGGAIYAQRAGKISCIQRAAPRTSIVTVSAYDTAGPLEIDTAASRIDRINTLRPRFWSEPHRWQMTALDQEVTAQAYRDEDGGVRPAGIDYPYVTDAVQASQLAALQIANTREGIAGVIPLKPHLQRIRPGDAFTITEAGFVLNGLKCLCLNTDYDPATGVVRVSFVSETDAKYPFALGQDPTPPTPQVLTPVDPRYVTPPSPGDWTVTVPGPAPDGSQLPNIDLTGLVSNDTADALLISWRAVASGENPNTPPLYLDPDGNVLPGWMDAGSYAPTIRSLSIQGPKSGAVVWLALRYRRGSNFSAAELKGPITVRTLVADVMPNAPGLSQIRSDIEAAFGEILDVSDLISQTRTELNAVDAALLGAIEDTNTSLGQASATLLAADEALSQAIGAVGDRAQVLEETTASLEENKASVSALNAQIARIDDVEAVNATQSSALVDLEAGKVEVSEYNTLKAEVAAARDGSPSLLGQIRSLKSVDLDLEANKASVSVVEALSARTDGAEAGLIDLSEALASESVARSESISIQSARVDGVEAVNATQALALVDLENGKVALSEYNTLKGEVVSARDGAPSLLGKIQNLKSVDLDLQNNKASVESVNALTARTASTEADIIDLGNALATETGARAQAISQITARQNVNRNLLPGGSGERGVGGWIAPAGFGVVDSPAFGGTIFYKNYTGAGSVDQTYVSPRVPVGIAPFITMSWRGAAIGFSGAGNRQIAYLVFYDESDAYKGESPFLPLAGGTVTAAVPTGATRVAFFAHVRGAASADYAEIHFEQIKIEPGQVATIYSNDALEKVLSATVTEQSLAIIDLENNQALASFRKIAEASGGAPAYYEFVSSSSGGYAAIAGPVVALVNTAPGGGAPLVALEAANGEVRVARRLYVGSGAGQFLIDAPNQIQTLRDASGNLRLELGLLP